ncbi:ligase-associated DNA damage response endonuclease PdeM [Hydrogenophaga palleronii]|uniref:ligase-associated DNA damage response endonuclease PdeM n=1 Tax=Hydrogenophaga palleronii TaxID=65655 RepID=UPI000824B36B|nr:ligase-associated DNA damage response endonuclease PdeM [Hydrogenophaga palleronii]
MAEHIGIELAGEPLHLYADRALYWPARQRLLVADVHLGKDDAFRSAGIALPRGGAAHDLARLSALLQHSGARGLWFLGDLLHGAHTDSGWRDAWTAFLARHAGLELLLIEGNHDRTAARAGLGIARQAQAVEDGPFVFDHMPRATQASDGLMGVCGHVHPVVSVPGFRGRFPAFVVQQGQLILPAFSRFTGGVRPPRAQARYACMGEHLLALGPGSEAARALHR